MQPPLARFRWPRLTDHELADRRRAFGFRRSIDHIHRGVDLGARSGTPVWSVGDGVVEHSVAAGVDRGFDGYGAVVVVRLEDGRRVLFAHLDSRTVERGERVAEGQQVGTVGTTAGTVASPGRRFGNSGAHLHFELASGPYPMEAEAARLDPGEFAMPPPDAPDSTAADSIERWHALDGLIVGLHRAVWPRLVNDEQRARADRGLLMWQVALRGAGELAPDQRAGALDFWIDYYNEARANAIKYGLKNAPPRARRTPTLAEQTDTAAERVLVPVRAAASGFATGLFLFGLFWLWSQQKSAERAS